MHYAPPKRSVWGHSLRKMKPAVQRERVDAFLSRSVLEYVFSTGSVFFQPATLSPSESSEFDRHFMELLGLAEPQPGFSNLGEEQFELCYREILARPSLFESGKRGATVAAFYTISAWNVEGIRVETNSMLGVYYGARSLIVPRFSFETMEVFDHLRSSLTAVGLCGLDPRHIKGRGS